ncbi:MAG: sugar phosphate isomerase/epimerase family protein [Candidatus Fimenecus sp.]
MQNIGLTTVTFRKKSRREVCEIARENEIQYMEWGGDVHLPPNDDIALQEVLALQREFGLTAISYGTYYRLGAEDYTLWEQIVNTAAAIGASIIRIWQGESSSAEVSRETHSAMVRETQILADMAEKKGLTVAFEFHKNTNNDNGKSAVAFLEAVNKPNVKTYWQPFCTKEDIENLKAVLPYLVCVHVFEWNESGKRYALRHGEKKWHAYLEVLKNSNIHPYMILEFVKRNSKRQFAKDVQTLRKLLAECQREGA